MVKNRQLLLHPCFGARVVFKRTRCRSELGPGAAMEQLPANLASALQALAPDVRKRVLDAVSGVGPGPSQPTVAGAGRASPSASASSSASGSAGRVTVTTSNAQARSRSYKCGACGGTGHNKRTCPALPRRGRALQSASVLAGDVARWVAVDFEVPYCSVHGGGLYSKMRNVHACFVGMHWCADIWVEQCEAPHHPVCDGGGRRAGS